MLSFNNIAIWFFLLEMTFPILSPICPERKLLLQVLLNFPSLNPRLKTKSSSSVFSSLLLFNLFKAFL